MDVTARNWRQMLDLAVAAGAVPEGMAQTVERGLALASGLPGAGGDEETVSLPLSLRDGQVFFGPIPLGPAPRFAPL